MGAAKSRYNSSPAAKAALKSMPLTMLATSNNLGITYSLCCISADPTPFKQHQVSTNTLHRQHRVEADSTTSCGLRSLSQLHVMSDLKGKQKCCLGLLYYSQALQAEGQKPVCLGVSHAPTERIKLEDNKLLREQHGFKFVCLGNSLYEPPTQQGGSADGQMQTLPYCEGLEVIIASNADAAATASSSGRQTTEDWTTVVSSMFGGDESAVGRGMARFNKIAARNWDRMKATANQAYTMTVKPVLDRLSGDQQ